MAFDSNKLSLFAQAFSFVGNSLMRPMVAMGEAPLHPEMWEHFPSFASPEVVAAARACNVACQRFVAQSQEVGTPAIELASDEIRHLFGGAPMPPAIPLESFYRIPEGEQPGENFGEAAYDMLQRLDEAGLQLGGGEYQMADHMGIEVLLLSVYCDSLAQDFMEENAEFNVRVAMQVNAVADYVRQHPLGWLDAFYAKAQAAAPGGYVPALLLLEKALLNRFLELA